MTETRAGARRIPGSGRPARALAIVLVAAAFASPARAHEPLWGETPTIFGPGVFHPEIRIGYLHRGGRPGPGEESTREIDQDYGLQYGINRFVNVRLRLPATRMEMKDNASGVVGDSIVSGAGDAVLDAKWRFRLRQDFGVQRSQALVIGWKMPTGDDRRTDSSGARLSPVDQPGSGRHGLELGWAADHERLVDTTWVSLFYRHDLGGGFRRGDRLEADAAYGRWVVRPNTGTDLGVILALGVHAETLASDRLDDGASAGNSRTVVGLQVTPIVTHGQTQFRIGVLVPVARSGQKADDFPYEVRAGWERFF